MALCTHGQEVSPLRYDLPTSHSHTYGLHPTTARLWFFFNVFRNAFVIIVLTFASWLYTRHRRSKSGSYPIKILKDVPRGFKHLGQPVIDTNLISALASGEHALSHRSPKQALTVDYRTPGCHHHSFPGTHCHLQMSVLSQLIYAPKLTFAFFQRLVA